MQIVKYDIETAVITALDAKYKDIQITDGKSYKFAMEGLAEYRELRLKIDAKHKDLKKDALTYTQAVDAEKRRLKELLAPGEDHLKAVRKGEDDRKEAIKEEKAQKERERVEAIQKKIFNIQKSTSNLTWENAKGLFEIQSGLVGVEITEEAFQEFTEEATRALNEAMVIVDEAYKARVKFEKEEAERAKEAQRLEGIRLEQEAKEKKLADEKRKIEEEKAKLEAEKERIKAEERDKKFIEEAQKAAQKEADEWVERKALEKKEREEKEAKEKERKAQLAPDKEKLLKWIASYNQTNNPSPRLKSQESIEIYMIAMEQIETILQDAEEKAEKL